MTTDKSTKSKVDKHTIDNNNANYNCILITDETRTKYMAKPVKKWKKRFLNSKNYGSALNLSSIFFFFGFTWWLDSYSVEFLFVCSSTFLVCMYVIYKMMCNGWMNLLNIQKKYLLDTIILWYKKKCSYADSHDSRRCCCFHDIMMSQMSLKNFFFFTHTNTLNAERSFLVSQFFFVVSSSFIHSSNLIS